MRVRCSIPPDNLSREHARLLLRKAEQDERLLEAVVADRRVTDEVFGFHCQQAVEKILKAVLASKAVAYRRTHDLEALFELLVQAETPLPEELRESSRFTGFAVEYRYADWPIDASLLDRAAAMSLITRIRRWAEDQIG